MRRSLSKRTSRDRSLVKGTRLKVDLVAMLAFYGFYKNSVLAYKRTLILDRLKGRLREYVQSPAEQGRRVLRQTV